MGKLRFEPKVKPLLNEKEYKANKSILEQAEGGAVDNHVYWDLEAGENAGKVRKAFLYVAEKEGVPLSVRAKRGSHCLQLAFAKSSGSGTSRVSADESRARIVAALSKAKGSLQKAEILNVAAISPSTWNIRIKELLEQGTVGKEGTGRRTKYRLVD